MKTLRPDGYYVIARNGSIHKLQIARWLTTHWPDTNDGEWLLCGSEVSLHGDDAVKQDFRVMSLKLTLLDLCTLPFPREA